MKILQVINSLSTGGAEKLITDAIITYRKMGYEVDLLLLSDSDTPFKNLLNKYPEITILSLGNNINIYSPLLIFKLNKYLKLYDIIHVHLFPAMYWVSIWKKISFSNKPIILTEHSTNNKRRSSIVFKKIDQLIYTQFDKIVTISKAAFDSLKQHLGKRFDNIITIDNGVNLDVIEKAGTYCRRDLGLSDDSYIITQVSSFRYPKDQKTVIKSLNLLDNDTHLILVGEGPLLQENIKLCKNLGLSNRVHFFGIRSDVPKLLKSSDIIVLSSIYEGLSLSSIEGLASGRPFIASEAPGLTDVVKNAGLLFKIQDEKDLAKKISKLRYDNDFYNETVIKCQKRAKEYDIKKMANDYLKLYKEMV